MRELSVIAEALAVIAGDDDQRGAILRAKIVEQRCKRRIGRRNLAVVRLAGVLSVEGRWRTVWRVGIEEMDPGEPRLRFPLRLRDPFARERHDGGRRALRHHELGRRVRFAESIVVAIEALVQSEA